MRAVKFDLQDFDNGFAFLPLEDSQIAREMVQGKVVGSRKLQEQLATITYHDRLIGQAVDRAVRGIRWHNAAGDARLYVADPLKAARGKLTAFLLGTTEEVLRGFCEKYHVDYKSFRDDKQECIEAILEEMFAVDGVQA